MNVLNRAHLRPRVDEGFTAAEVKCSDVVIEDWSRTQEAAVEELLSPGGSHPGPEELILLLFYDVNGRRVTWKANYCKLKDRIKRQIKQRH